MNRIEIIGLFTALDELCEMKKLDSVQRIVKEVLHEAKTKNTKKPEKDPE
jgi:hypothetical protein